MVIKSKHSTVSLIPTASPSAKLGSMAEEDSSTNLLKEILAQIQVLKLIQQDLAELKCDFKTSARKKWLYKD